MIDSITVFFEKSVERDRIVHEMPKLLKALTEFDVSLDMVDNKNHTMENFKLESPHFIDSGEETASPLSDLVKCFILMEMWGTAESSSEMLKFLFFELGAALRTYSGRTEEDIYIDIGLVIQKRLESIQRFRG